MSGESTSDAQWSQARSLEDVAALTADWLEGSVASQPGYAREAGPDEESLELVPVLAAVNRAGYLTTCSQPGHEPTVGADGAVWAQRPAVEGFIHHGSLLRELVTRGQAAGMLVVLEQSPQVELPFPPVVGGAVGVTTRDDQPYTVFGHRHNQYREDELCPAAAAADIDRAAHLTLVDPDFRDGRRLWDLLLAAVDAAAAYTDEMTELVAPAVKFRSTSWLTPDAITTWRADLEMLIADGAVGDDPVHVGFAAFTVVRLAAGYSIAALLEEFGSERAQLYGELFEGDDLGDELEAGFGDGPPIHTVILIESVVIAESARGHDLGAWMVSEVVARMSGAIDTLVLLYPYPAVARTGEADELAAVTALSAHWAKVGLEQIPQAPMFLGASTAFVGLGEAHARLNAAAEDVQVLVPRALFGDPRPGGGSMLPGEPGERWEAEATAGGDDDAADDLDVPPGLWTLAHRGFSGGGRLDVWLFPTKLDALREGAAMAMEFGLDRDAAARAMLEAEDFQGVLDRFDEWSPESHLLRVQMAYLSN